MTLPAGDPAGEPVTSTEIASLIARMRRLSQAGIGRADPAELAAFHHAKHDLLTRIRHHTQTPNAPSDTPPEQAGDPHD